MGMLARQRTGCCSARGSFRGSEQQGLQGGAQDQAASADFHRAELAGLQQFIKGRTRKSRDDRGIAKSKRDAFVRSDIGGFVAHSSPSPVEMVRNYGQKSTVVEMCNSACENLSRTISHTIFSRPLWPWFLVASQFFDELHRALLREARNLQPHDFGAFFLADKAARIS